MKSRTPSQLRALLFKARSQSTKMLAVRGRVLRCLLPIILLWLLARLFPSSGGDLAGDDPSAAGGKSATLQVAFLRGSGTQQSDDDGASIRATASELGVPDLLLGWGLTAVLLFSLPTLASARAEDRAGGVRSLLRSNGVGSAAYWGASVIEANLNLLLDAALVLVGAAALVKQRLVWETSSLWLIYVVLLLSNAIVATASLLGQARV